MLLFLQLATTISLRNFLLLLVFGDVFSMNFIVSSFLVLFVKFVFSEVSMLTESGS